MDRGGPPTAVHLTTAVRAVRRDSPDNPDNPGRLACRKTIRPWTRWRETPDDVAAPAVADAASAPRSPSRLARRPRRRGPA